MIGIKFTKCDIVCVYVARCWTCGRNQRVIFFFLSVFHRLAHAKQQTEYTELRLDTQLILLNVQICPCVPTFIIKLTVHSYISLRSIVVHRLMGKVHDLFEPDEFA